MTFPFGALINQAAQARTAFSGGKQAAEKQGQQDQLSQALMLLKLKRDQEQDALSQALGQSKMGLENAQRDAALRPPVPRNMDPNGTEARAGKLADALALLNAKPKPAERLVPIVQGNKSVYAKQSEAPGMEVPKPPIQDSFTAEKFGGEGGAPAEIRAFSHKYGTAGKPLGPAPVTNDLMNPLAMMNLTRGNSAIQGLNVADRQMRPMEDAMLAKKFNYTGWDQFRKIYADAAANPHGDPKLIDTGAISAAIDNLNRTNPQLAEYLKASSAWALEDSNISQRPSDFRTRLDEVVSSIGPHAPDGVIRNVQEMRGVRLKGYNESLPAIQERLQRAQRTTGGGRAGGGGNTPPANFDGTPTPAIQSAGGGGKPVSAEDAAKARANPAFADWLKKNGYVVP